MDKLMLKFMIIILDDFGWFWIRSNSM